MELIYTNNKIIKPSEIEGLRFYEVKGVSIGPVSNICSEVNRNRAHAHVTNDPLFGYICITEDLVYRGGTKKPSEILWHEIFHVLTDYSEVTAEELNNSLEVQHNLKWKKTAIYYGRPWIAASGVYVNANWVYNPPNGGEPTWNEWDHFSNTRATNSGSSLTRAMTYR